MPTTVVLAVGLASEHFAAQTLLLRSAGLVIVPVWSIREAIDHFKTGDFDLVLLGHSLAAESKERLASLIHRSGSRTPVISIGSSSGDSDAFADATLVNEPANLQAGIADFLARQSRFPMAQARTLREAS
ncbi:MAG: hypothetical protein ABSD67_04895 [Terracidiphilus sp.]|jgi:DNA-binding response OmpR family regulator